jgi:hypothetical protein
MGKKEKEIWRWAITTDSDWQKTDLISSERAPHRDKDKDILTELISGRKSQGGLDAKTYWLTDWLTDRQS